MKQFKKLINGRMKKTAFSLLCLQILRKATITVIILLYLM